MDTALNLAKSISSPVYEYEYSICTLVTRKVEYEEMLDSFLLKGFDEKSCEYLFIDNSSSCSFEAYKGLNQFLQQAKGKYIILCHQDIIIHDHDRNHLSERISEIEKKTQTGLSWPMLVV